MQSDNRQFFLTLAKKNPFMKFFKLSFWAIAAILFSVACQKEYSYESDGPSVGQLQTIDGVDCDATVHGIFKADSAINAATHYIDVMVLFSAPGSYSIHTDTVNGYSFRAQSIATAPGVQSVRLLGAGKPLVSGTDLFTIQYDNSTCLIEVSVVPGNTPPAAFTVTGTSDSCTSYTVHGNYIVGTPVTAAEFVTLTVDVTSIGTYNLTATSPGGVNFAGSGVFSSTGLQNVTLNASGTPTTAGENTVMVQGTSACPFVFTAIDNGTPPPSDATYSFAVNGTDCAGATLTGSFEAGTQINGATATITVNVTSVGNYSISSNTVNGISFSATGVFAASGTQQVVLTASGTPAAAGDFNFTVTGSGSSCGFTCTVTSQGTPPPPANEEYLPMTATSNFTVALVGGTPDDTSHIRVLANPISLGGQSYQIFEYTFEDNPEDSSLYRKSNGRYYEYFTYSYGLDNPFNTDGMILDSNLNVNDTWTVDLGSNSVGGQALEMSMIGKVLEKNATATLAGTTYDRIIKVVHTYVIHVNGQDIPALENTLWFAKGKGIVYQKLNDLPVTSTQEIVTSRVYIAP